MGRTKRTVGVLQELAGTRGTTRYAVNCYSTACPSMRPSPMATGFAKGGLASESCGRTRPRPYKRFDRFPQPNPARVISIPDLPAKVSPEKTMLLAGTREQHRV